MEDPDSTRDEPVVKRAKMEITDGPSMTMAELRKLLDEEDVSRRSQSPSMLPKGSVEEADKLHTQSTACRDRHQQGDSASKIACCDRHQQGDSAIQAVKGEGQVQGLAKQLKLNCKTPS